MFEPFNKIPRLKRDCVITEKIDGTNAQVFIWDIKANDPSKPPGETFSNFPWIAEVNGVYVAAGSRNRWIAPHNDNYGFAKWVQDNAEELIKLGPGRHFGEWWGAGIQRRYGLTEKRFSLFNVGRWVGQSVEKGDQVPPACCLVVPVLYQGPFDTQAIDRVVEFLKINGSQAAPGFKDPEGIIIYHAASRQLFKQTLKDDESPKSIVQRFDSCAERANTTA